MLKPLLIVVFAAGLMAGHAALLETYSFTGINREVPDGSAAGVTDSRAVSSAISSIDSITIGLNISGGYNGDLYVYLQHGSGFSILLNRPGKTATDSYGYGDSGFNIRFDDSAANDNVHLYQLVLTPAAGSPLTGTWQPDARNVDPDAVTAASSQTAYLSSFNGLDASGTWTLFVADTLSGGGTPMLNSWDMQISSSVPEPTALALGIFGGLGVAGRLFVWCRRKLRV